jgi:hypothetical protein
MSISELHYNVKEGTHPIFGYPLVCYTPIHKRTVEETGVEKKDGRNSNWQTIYHSVMKAKAKG